MALPSGADPITEQYSKGADPRTEQSKQGKKGLNVVVVRASRGTPAGGCCSAGAWCFWVAVVRVPWFSSLAFLLFSGDVPRTDHIRP